MIQVQKKPFTFTGWHMLAIMLSFFGVIISVNFFMAYQAVSSWSGLVVQNTYVASQQFNSKVAAERALAATGVTGKLTIDGTVVRYEISGPNGLVAADELILAFRRPVGDQQDFSLTLAPQEEGIFVVRHEVGPGHWIVEAIAARNGTPVLHQTRRISVHGERS
ncbi:FixH family protein [Rhizobium panacihumi]|uniref:FixH family protein n=1 Tax=Rhizobium panacihumi TaxID=2008450 RepID=UPI003D798D76